MTDGPHNVPPRMPGAPVSIVDRAKNIVLTPQSEWPVVAAEPTTVQTLFTSYAMILAAIAPIASIIGSFLFAARMGAGYAPPIALIIVTAIVSYAVSLGIVFLMGLIIDALSPAMGGVKDRVGAFKIAVYVTTPVWLMGILSIYPPLALLIFLAYLYVIYLIYTGLGPVLKVPQDKAVGFTVVIVVCYIVLVLVISAIVAAVIMTALASAFIGAAGTGMPY